MPPSESLTCEGPVRLSSPLRIFPYFSGQNQCHFPSSHLKTQYLKSVFQPTIPGSLSTKLPIRPLVITEMEMGRDGGENICNLSGEKS